MEQNDEWTEARRYVGLDILAKIDALTTQPADTTQEVKTIEPISA
jgi:hypothetical protein